MSRLKNLWGLLRTAGGNFLEDNTFLQGAALAYYTVFSIAPIAIIAIAIAGFVFGQPAAQQELGKQISQLAGSSVARSIEDMAKASTNTGANILATVISVVVLLIGATTVFAQLQSALNTIWKVDPNKDRGIWATVRDRLLSFGLVVVIGFLLLVSLIVSAALSALGQLLPGALPGGDALWQVVNGIISFLLITLLFAMIFKILPETRIRWRDVWMGAAATALLFTIGKYLIGLYLGQSGVVSSYGAAGSLVVILLWVYYSSQILLFGAEFTHVYANWKATDGIAAGRSSYNGNGPAGSPREANPHQGPEAA